MSSQAHRLSLLRFLAVSAVILWLTLWVRLADPYRQPVFVDEGTHIIWAQQFIDGRISYPLLMDGRILWGVALALFQPVGPNPLWQVRAAMAIFAGLGGAACIALGARLGSRRAGLLAGLLYAFLPYVVFHERQALADPFSAVLGALAICLVLRVARTRHLSNILALAGGLAAAILAKLSGVTYLVFLFLAPVLLPRTRKEKWALAARYGLAAGLTIGMLVFFTLILSSRLGVNDGNLVYQNRGYVGCPPILCQGDGGEQLRRLQAFGPPLIGMIPSYFGWPVMGLVLLAWLPNPCCNRRAVALLILSTLAMAAAFLLAAKAPGLPPRYLSFVAVPVTVLAAQGLISAARWVATRGPRPASRRIEVGLAGVLVLAVAWSTSNTIPILFAPAQARLPSFDQMQYATGVFCPFSLVQAAFTIRAEAARLQRPPLVLVSEPQAEAAWELVNYCFSPYFDRARVRPTLVEQVQWPALVQALVAGQHIYLVDEPPTGMSAKNSAPSASLVALYPPLNHQPPLRLRRFGEAGSTALHELFAVMFPRPEAYVTAYDQLADSLIEQTTPTLVVTYPPQQTAFLNERLGLRPPNSSLHLLDLGSQQPWDSAAAFQQLANAASSEQVKAVFLDEKRLDPERTFETGLAARLFYVGEQWYGPLRIVTYVSSASAAQVIPVGAKFGETITLERLEIIDSAPRPGQVMRVRLVWQTAAPVPLAYKVFAHLISGEKLVAQHDGQPAGEMHPTPAWQVGETIADQFAILLPGDVPAGIYQLRIGLYDAATQERVPVQLAGGNPAEFYVGGTITIH